jgi:hypothetical protein
VKNRYLFKKTCVADPDPGSGAFLTPGSGMGNISGSGSGMNNPDHTISDADLGSGMEKMRTRDGKILDPGSVLRIRIPDPVPF